MIKEIKYKGYTATPSDYDCPDGELDSSLGMIYENGALRPMHEGQVLCTLQDEIEILKLCRPDGKNGCIVKKESCIYFWDRDTKPNFANGNLIYCFSGDTLHNVEVIGNTLAIILGSGIRYAKWNGTTYKNIGQMPEIPKISFGLNIHTHKGGVFDYHYYKDIATSEEKPVPTTDEMADLAHKREVEFTSLMGEANKILADKMDKNFCYPFYVRYAYRLYDGTLTKHSSPILMIPAVYNPTMITELPHQEDKHNRTLYRLTPYVIYSELVFRAESTIGPEWNDIIKGVDVFVSAPEYTFDMGAKSEDYVAKIQNLDNIKPIFGRLDNVGYREMTTRDILNRYIPVQGSTICLPLKHNYLGKIGECGTFYKYATLSVGSLNVNDSFKEIKSDVSDLNVLTQQEVMTDDFSSHNNLTGKVSFTYNKRLIVGNVQKQLYDDFDLNSSVTYTDTNISGSFRIYIKKNGKVNVIGCNNIPMRKIRYLFYPDPAAYEMRVQYGSSFYRYELKPHPFLYGAYFYNDLNPGVWAGVTLDDLVKYPYSAMNEVYVSEVNNPFVFPAKNVVAVGSGNILALSSTTHALSEGQFGRFPLYVFTDDGVWSMEVASDGTFRSAHPVSRDVCKNADSVCQIDNAVVFITSRGVMLLEGSKCTCISDVLDGGAFNVNNYPQLRDVAVLSGYATAKDETSPETPDKIDKVYDLNVVNRNSFDMFLKGAKILYDYKRQHLILYNPGSAIKYAYVFSFKSKAWGMMECNFKSNPNSYTEAIVVDDKKQIINFSSEGTLMKGFVFTRPLKLDMPDVMKTIDTAIQRGSFGTGIKCALYGSRDLVHWFLVSSSVNHEMRGFSGTPYKYFRIALICDFSEGESVSGASINMRPKMVNKLR